VPEIGKKIAKRDGDEVNWLCSVTVDFLDPTGQD
jgi:hypothetical protein